MENTSQATSQFEELESRIALQLLQNIEAASDKTHAISEYSSFLYAVTQRQNLAANQWALQEGAEGSAKPVPHGTK